MTEWTTPDTLRTPGRRPQGHGQAHGQAHPDEAEAAEAAERPEEVAGGPRKLS